MYNEKQYLQDMISNLRQAINNASQFGDTVTVEAIQRQINAYENRLAQLNREQ